MQISYEELYDYLYDYGNDNYYAFPSTLYTFCTGVGGAYPRIEFLKTGVVIGRERKHEFKICYFDCTIQELKEFVTEELKVKPKVKVMGFYLYDETYQKNKKILGKDSLEYFAYKGYNLAQVVSDKKASSRKVINRSYRHGEEMYTIDLNPTKEEAIKVLEDWNLEAASRHEMVFKGHYRSYVNKHFDGVLKNTKFIGFRDLSGKLHGIVLYEIFKGIACVCVEKHYCNDNRYVVYCHIKTTEMMLEEAGSVHNGSDCDEFKTYMGLTPRQTFTIK